jgi:voltage-gated potassium channel
MATITTVGYGDIYPKTPAGRGVAVFLMLLGISLFGILTARIASFFVRLEAPDPQHGDLDAVLTRLERIEERLRALTRDRQDDR